MPTQLDKASGKLCPYCGREMESGAILGEAYPIRWQPDDKQLVAGIWSTGSRIGDYSLTHRPRVSGYRCAACDKIIVDGAINDGGKEWNWMRWIIPGHFSREWFIQRAVFLLLLLGLGGALAIGILFFP